MKLKKCKLKEEVESNFTSQQAVQPMSLRLSDLIILVLLYCPREGFMACLASGKVFSNKKLNDTSVFKIEFQQDFHNHHHHHHHFV